jgi:hypothetical protein
MAAAKQQASAEDATAVATAGAEAAAQADTPQQAETNAREAMKAKRDETGFPMSDEDIDKIAQKFVELTVGELEDRGAFERPPERVEAVEPETVAAREATAPPGEAGQPAQVPQTPAPRSFAQKFMGA